MWQHVHTEMCAATNPHILVRRRSYGVLFRGSMIDNTQPQQSHGTRPWWTALACFAILFASALCLHAVITQHESFQNNLTIKLFSTIVPWWLAWYPIAVWKSRPVILVLCVLIPVLVLVFRRFVTRRAKRIMITSCAAMHVLLFLGYWCATTTHWLSGFSYAFYTWIAGPLLLAKEIF